jgi:hypothetical protein
MTLQGFNVYDFQRICCWLMIFKESWRLSNIWLLMTPRFWCWWFSTNLLLVNHFEEFWSFSKNLLLMIPKRDWATPCGPSPRRLVNPRSGLTLIRLQCANLSLACSALLLYICYFCLWSCDLVLATFPLLLSLELLSPINFVHFLRKIFLPPWSSISLDVNVVCNIDGCA